MGSAAPLTAENWGGDCRGFGLVAGPPTPNQLSIFFFFFPFLIFPWNCGGTPTHNSKTRRKCSLEFNTGSKIT